MILPTAIQRLVARRRCIGELTRLSVTLDSMYAGTPFDMETPDGYLSDEIGGEQLLDDMYMIQEEFVGGLSFWPNINIQGLLQQIVAKAQTIRDGLPAEYPMTKQRFDALVTEMREAEPRCSELYNFGFNKDSQ
ncbi:hypothetical protein ACFRAU_23130 [Arthrobacter sp. NPDC056691]|uniref:hypothetical protein n=1 Tax=Arthrobacter sp. NPDC056691 TaxID=3345913 RepID=UPI00366ED129